MKPSIVVVGSLNMDLVVHTPHHPQPGETIIGSTFNTFPGGKGANQAVAAARLGGQVATSGRVAMVGRVGTDAFGESLLETLKRDGVDTRFVQADPQAPTGVALIAVDDAGENTIIVASGANARLLPEDIEAAEAAFDGAQVLLLQLESPLPAVQRAVEVAHRHGLKVVLNPAPAPVDPLPASLLTGVDVLIPNQTELTLLAGVDSQAAAASLLHNLGVKNLVVTLGDEGALVIENHVQTRLPARQVTVVDTTAAGDAFVGAFAVALTEGRSILEAAHWGIAAGALAVTKEGAQPSLPHRAEFDLFLQEPE